MSSLKSFGYIKIDESNGTDYNVYIETTIYFTF